MRQEIKRLLKGFIPKFGNGNHLKALELFDEAMKRDLTAQEITNLKHYIGTKKY